MTLTYTARTVMIHGRELYVEQAAGFPGRPTLVFLHDSLGCTRLWRDFPEKLALLTRCNVLVYDRWGYGQSAPMSSYKRPVHYMEQEAGILKELLSDSGLQDVILFGHSDGGTIALLTAALYSDIVKGIICEAGHIFVEDITLEGIRKAVTAYHTTDLAARLNKYHGDKTDTVFKAWTETWLRSNYRSWNIEALLPSVTSPLLFIQGEQDEYGTAAQADRTVALVTGSSEKWMLPGVGHTPHKEAPGPVLEKSADFIRQLL
ncbi:MAG: alpha/beta hydrolase [Bacteroidetes bacterium 47-18]|nr:MAG: alpha/beta hydrolase [Bacteroidetes bacterium 47-18]